MTEYRPVVGYETRYGVSREGDVMSFSTGRLMSLTTNTSKYKVITLYDGIDHIPKFVHVLVAEAYLKKKDLKQTQVDHIDGRKQNNNLSNLRFATQTENTINAHRNNNNMQRSRKAVCKLDNDGNVIETYESITLAAQNNGLRTGTPITGFHWMYQNEEKKIELEIDEVFKKIDEIDGIRFNIYEISSYGKVRNIKSQKFLAPETSTGYERFSLSSEDHDIAHFFGHRIVAYFFIKKINDPKIVVNHIDKNKMSNHFSNLEWVTYSKNTLHSIGKKVCRIDKDTGDILRTYNSATCASKILKKPKSRSHIGSCCNNNVKTVCGYIWKFLETIINEMVADGYVKIVTKELIEYCEGTLVSFITNDGQLRHGRILTCVENNKLIYTKDDKRFTFQLSNIKEIWIKKCKKHKKY